MKNKDDLVKIIRCICIQDLKDITINEFEGMKINNFKKNENMSIMLFEGLEGSDIVSLEMFKTKNKIKNKYSKKNWENGKDFIINKKSPILHNAKIQSAEIFILKKVLKTNFSGEFIDLVCENLDNFVKELDDREKLNEILMIKESSKVLNKK